MADGLLDTNVFIHSHAGDSFTQECRGFLAALEQGSVHAVLEPVVLHELSYALPHYVKQMTREDVAEYLLMVLGWDGIRGDKDLMVDTVERWRGSPGLSFADAYLAAAAALRGCPVYSKNVRDFESQGVSVPQPLLSEPAPVRRRRGPRRSSTR